MRKRGMTYAEVGRRFGISRGRAHEIFQRADDRGCGEGKNGPCQIALSAYEDTPWRLVRLAKVLAGCPEETVRLLHGLHDHKGTLEIDWKSPPELLHCRALIDLWATQCEYCWQHLVNGRRTGPMETAGSRENA